MVINFKPNLKILFFVFAGAALVVSVFLFVRMRSMQAVLSSQSKIENKKVTYSLVNPTVQANLGKHFIINFSPLKEKFTGIQNKYPQKTYIYFAYLNNATWVGLNEKDMFTAASTVKVPLAMSVYKMAEQGKIKMSDTYSLDELDLSDQFGDLYKVGPDKQFTIEELVKIMLEKSDNTAMNGIYNALKRVGIDNPLDDVYNDMGWEFNDFGQQPNYQQINLKTLSNMFLALYNAAYVNAEDSQRILNFLANTPFNDEIVAGVSADTTVAHKIGVATDNETFSDCGIVYAPNRNYILCVGSNGGDEKVAAQFMAEISKAAYSFVINN